MLLRIFEKIRTNEQVRIELEELEFLDFMSAEERNGAIHDFLEVLSLSEKLPKTFKGNFEEVKKAVERNRIEIINQAIDLMRVGKLQKEDFVDFILRKLNPIWRKTYELERTN